MFGMLTRWWERRQRHRAAVAAAVRHFGATIGREALPASTVIGEEAGGYIVRVCHGDYVKPPHRVWYRVGQDGTVVAQLTFDEARAYGERGWK